MKTTIGVYGCGIVGQAHADYFAQRGVGVSTYDAAPSKRNVASPAELLASVGNGVIFVAVPTPANHDGSCSLDAVRDAMSRLNEAARDRALRPTVVLKSTVPVGTSRSLQAQNRDVWLCYSPEFLTEAQSLLDFYREEVILCGPAPVTHAVRELFRLADPDRGVLEQVQFEAGELVKHIRNVTLAVTVSLANEFAQFAEKFGVSYDTVRELAQRDRRLPQSHFRVPGPDGLPGYGGICLPKDLASFLTQCAALGVPANVVAGAEATNALVRPERDWERHVGRAVVG